MLYEAWKDDASGVRFDNNYRELFMELQQLIDDALKSDLHDNHSKRRGWTPPPKGYAEEQLKNQKD